MKTANQKKKTLSAKPAAVKKRGYSYTCLTLRFADEEHHQLVKDAADAAKMSVNGWLIYVTLEAARRGLAGARA